MTICVPHQQGDFRQFTGVVPWHHDYRQPRAGSACCAREPRTAPRIRTDGKQLSPGELKLLESNTGGCPPREFCPAPERQSLPFIQAAP